MSSILIVYHHAPHYLVATIDIYDYNLNQLARTLSVAIRYRAVSLPPTSMTGIYGWLDAFNIHHLSLLTTQLMFIIGLSLSLSLFLLPLHCVLISQPEFSTTSGRATTITLCWGRSIIIDHSLQWPHVSS
jgi:hypothetical protein